MVAESGIRIELLPRLTSLSGEDLVLVVDTSTNETSVIEKSYFDRVWITQENLLLQLGDYYNKGKINWLLDKKANAASLDLFYSKTETNNLLNTKSDKTHTHADYVSSIVVYNELKKKADIGHVHPNMATKYDLEVSAARKADVDHHHSEYIRIEDAAPKVHTHPEYVLETTFNTAMAGKSDVGHSHSDLYYSQIEVDAKLSGKANVEHYHEQYLETSQFTNIISQYSTVDHGHFEYAEKAWTNRALDTKANALHKHPEYATNDDLFAGLELKAEVEHTHEQYVLWSSLAISLAGKSDVGHIHTAKDTVYVPDNPSHYHLEHRNVQTALDELASRYRDAEKVEYQPKSIASWEEHVAKADVPVTVAQALDILVNNLGDSNSVIDGGFWN